MLRRILGLRPPCLALVSSPRSGWPYELSAISIHTFVTMSSSPKNWSKEKDRLSKLSLEERRKGYFCSDKYTPFEQIPTWKEFFLLHEKNLSERVSEKDRNKFTEEEGAAEASDQNLDEKVSIFQGDITKLEIDCIVNAANESLLGGGGVDGAIHRGAGKKLLEECRTLKGCETGEAKITSGYKLPAKYVIHTVGPIGEKPKLLESCYKSSLRLMIENNLRTIAFPCISTGIYGYPPENAAPIAIKTVKQFVQENPDKVDRVIFCVFLDKDVDIYEQQLQLFFPVKSSA